MKKILLLIALLYAGISYSQITCKIVEHKMYRTEKTVYLKLLTPHGDTLAITKYATNSEMIRIRDGGLVLLTMTKKCEHGEYIKAKVKIL